MLKKILFSALALILYLEAYAEPVPYLQTPTHNSIWINWRTTNEKESKVLYGETTEALENMTNGDAEFFTSTEDNNYSYTYHSVQLTGLKPDTRYFYKVISGDQQSNVYSFKTQPVPGSKGIYRFIILGDHQLQDDRYVRLMKGAKSIAEKKYGTPIEDHINLITNVGDQVNAGTLKEYDITHFKKSETLSPNLPIMTIIGNHDVAGNNPLKYYNDHFIYDKIEYKGIKSNSEYYYAMQQGRALFLMLSSEHAGMTQYKWAKQVIEKAIADDEIDWIFSYNHRPLQAEQYVGDVSEWVRDQIMPLLNKSEKSVMNVAGHHHLYHRGQLRDYPTYHIISGGASWDQRWGQGTEQDFDDVQKTIDYWPFQIVELNSETGTMTVETYVTGNQAETFAEPKLVDSFFRTSGKSKPEKPYIEALEPADAIELPYTFKSSAYSSQTGYDYNSVQFQVASDATFSDLEFDLIRDYENIYGKHPVGAKFVDLHKDINIFEQTLKKEDLHNGIHFIRVRHRDRNLEWSDWSEPVTFTTVNGIEGDPELELSKEKYLPDEEVSISFKFAPGESGQWIGIFKEGQNPVNGVISTKWDYVSGSEGIITFSLEPGAYYATLFRDSGYDLLYRTKYFYVGVIPKLETESTVFEKGETIKVKFSNGPGLQKDWIGVYKEGQIPGSSSDQSLAWTYINSTSGECTFNNLPVGDYFVSYFIKEKYYEPAERIYFQVVEPTSVESEKSPTLVAYQDAANRKLNVKYTTNIKESGTLFNLNGMAVKSFSFENYAIISTDDISAGVYILRINNETKKIIIQ